MPSPLPIGLATSKLWPGGHHEGGMVRIGGGGGYGAAGTEEHWGVQDP